MTFVFYFLLFVFWFLCCLLIFSVLMQESKSMGLGASFGGDVKDSIFGTSTANVLKKITVYLASFFLIFCILLSFYSSALGRRENLKKKELEIEEVVE